MCPNRQVDTPELEIAWPETLGADVRAAFTALVADYKRRPPTFYSRSDHRALIISWVIQFARQWKDARSIHFPVIEAAEHAQLVRKTVPAAKGDTEVVRKVLNRIRTRAGDAHPSGGKILASVRHVISQEERSLELVFREGDSQRQNVHAGISLVVTPEDEEAHRITHGLTLNSPSVLVHVSHTREVSVDGAPIPILPDLIEDIDVRAFVASKLHERVTLSKHQLSRFLGAVTVENETCAVQWLENIRYRGIGSAAIRILSPVAFASLSTLLSELAVEMHAKSMSLEYVIEDEDQIWATILNTVDNLDPQPMITDQWELGGRTIRGSGPGTIRYFARVTSDRFTVCFSALDAYDFRDSMHGFALRSFMQQNFGLVTS